MTPRLPRPKGDQLVRALEKAGFQVARVKGSHHFLRHPDGRATTVPVHAGEMCFLSALAGRVAGDWRWRAVAMAVAQSTPPPSPEVEKRPVASSSGPGRSFYHRIR
jgi:predicted RNA binding protein YcfA (HicA-like mRNA interferase family)